MTITKKEIEILSNQDDNTLAKWWCLLNSWGWPDELPNPEMREDFQSSTHDSPSRRWELMCWIEEKVGSKLCIRVWNADMTDEEHNAWRRKNKKEMRRMEKIVKT